MKRRTKLISVAAALLLPVTAVISCSSHSIDNLKHADSEKKYVSDFSEGTTNHGGVVVPHNIYTTQQNGMEAPTPSYSVVVPPRVYALDMPGFSNTVTDHYSPIPSELPVVPPIMQALDMPGFSNTVTDHYVPTKKEGPMAVPQKQAAPKLDRSGKGVWTTGVKHISNMKNGMNDDCSTIKRNQEVTVDMFETALFKYAVDMQATMGKDSAGNPLKITHEKIEEIVRIFEKHVNYGPGAHMIRTDHTYKYVDKMTLELYRSSETPGLSMGSEFGTELSLHANFPNTFTMAALLLHEYGHHETLVDAKIFHDNRHYRPWMGVHFIDEFQKLKNDLLADRELRMYARYFNSFFDVWTDMDGRHITHDIDTPLGKLEKGTFAFGGPKYVYHASEFVTRAQMLLEMSLPKETLLSQVQYRGELAGFADTFDGKTPLSDHIKEKLINLFLNDVYPIDKFAEEGIDWVTAPREKAVVDGIIATRDIHSKQIDHIVVKMIAREGKRTTINVSKDQLKKELGEFHFNTDFTNDTPEISKQIYMYSIDTDKLSKEDAEQVKEWLNFTAQIEFYDEDNNLMKTTGSLIRP